MSKISNKYFFNRNFIHYFRSLSATEVVNFQIFAHTAISTLNAQEREILDLTIAAYPDFKILNATLNAYFNDASTPSTADNYINHCFYSLSQVLKNWLIQQEVAADELLQKQLLLRVNKKRFQHSQFFKNATKTLDFLETDQLAIPDNWLHQQRLHADVFYHTLSQKFTPNPTHLRDMESHLDLYYYGLKTRLLAQKLLRRQFIKEDVIPDDAQDLLAFSAAHQQLTFFFLYEKLIRYFLQPDDVFFKEIITVFQEKHLELDRTEQAIFINFLTSALTTKVNSGNVFYQKMQFDLFKFALAKDLVMLDNEMSPSFLNNFFLLACLLKEFKFAKKVLKEYSPLLPDDIASDLVNLLNCTLLFHQKKYEKAEGLLEIVHFQHIGFKINGRVLLLKCFYERLQKDHSFKATFLAELVSFKKFINRQTILTSNKKTTITNIVKVLRQFAKFKFSPHSKRRTEKERIGAYLQDATTSVRSKVWLLEKFKEL